MSGRDKYRTSAPSLGDVLAKGDGDVAVVTIHEVKDQTFTDSPNKSRVTMVVLTEEYPESPYFPNAGRGGAIDRLYDKLGENQADWIGARVPMTRVKNVFNPSENTYSDKFHVAPLAEWDEILAAFGEELEAPRKPRSRKRGK